MTQAPLEKAARVRTSHHLKTSVGALSDEGTKSVGRHRSEGTQSKEEGEENAGGKDGGMKERSEVEKETEQEEKKEEGQEERRKKGSSRDTFWGVVHG